MIGQAFLDSAGINIADASTAELDALFQVVDGNLLLDLGAGNSLQINGVTNYNAVLDDMDFIYLEA